MGIAAILAACLQAVAMAAEFDGNLPDPDGGFAIGAACGVCCEHGRRRGFAGGVGSRAPGRAGGGSV